MAEHDLFQNQNGGSIPTSPLIKQCWQKIKKDEFLEYNKQDLFSKWWDEVSQTKQNIVVKEINRDIADSFIKKHEWLGTLPVNYKYFYGAFSSSYLLSVCCFVEVKFGGRFTLFNEPAICLGRGATIFYAKKWIPSFLISRCCNMLINQEPRYVVAYSDWEAGEIGTIYQACNWIYLGHTKTKEWIDREGNRYDINTPIVRCVSGFQRRNNPELRASKEEIEIQKDKMIKDGFKLVNGPTRGRYAFVYGQKGKRYEYLMSILKDKSKPYPKRQEYDEFKENP